MLFLFIEVCLAASSVFVSIDFEGEGEVADKPCTLEAQDLLRGLAGEPVDKLGGTPQQGLKVLASTASIRTPVSQLAALQRPTSELGVETLQIIIDQPQSA